MPAITHDNRSFMIDGRRVWLVSGRVPYTNIPRDRWADAVNEARNAGLNTVEVPVVWSRHEQRQGRFDFTGENDLRHFVDLIGKAGMYCILGLGPYVGGGWDMGGLPWHLESLGTRGLRSTDHTFLESAARFFGAVAEQVRGWQVTAPGTGGPIILIQCESRWTCGHKTLAQSYLGELTRYIRESGLNVPVINANNLWHSVEGQIDGWSGNVEMLAMMRQLAAVRSQHPRVVIDFAAASPTTWNREAPPVISPRELERRLAEILAGGGQFNLTTFCGGSHAGFAGGRLEDSDQSFVTQSADHGCCLDAAGVRTGLFAPLRRVAHMASSFGRVFSSLDPAYQPVTIKPADAGTQRPLPSAKRVAHAHSDELAVVHATGAQGGVVFLFAEPEHEGAPTKVATLLLADGSELPVPVGAQPVTWCLLDVNVSPRCKLDYSNLSAFGSTGTVLVVFGPAGAKAMLSVNGAPVEAAVPTDATPTVLLHEGLTVVIVREEDVDHVSLGDGEVFVGVAGLKSDGTPVVSPGSKGYTRIAAEGKTRFVPNDVPRPRPHPAEKLSLEDWSHAGCGEYADGQSPRYASIAGLSNMTQLGSPLGYGWYRVRFDATKARKALLDPALGGDRLHIYHDGKAVGVAGVGPGAKRQIDLSLKKGPQSLVVLAENLGRFAGGTCMGEPKGLIDDLYEVVPVKFSKKQVQQAEPTALMAFRAPLWDVGDGDTTGVMRMQWTFRAAGDMYLLRVDEPPASGLVLLNGKTIAYLDRSGPGVIVIDEEMLAKGNNTIELTIVPQANEQAELAHAADSVSLFEVAGGLAGDAELAFAKWEVPTAANFAPKRPAQVPGGLPGWWRAGFTLPKGVRSAWFEADGLSKGQVFINGKHLGRYFVATENGKAVPPQTRYHIPPHMLRAEESNELMIFDEHGSSPGKCGVRAG
jgi:hypothetical protein